MHVCSQEEVDTPREIGWAGVRYAFTEGKTEVALEKLMTYEATDKGTETELWFAQDSDHKWFEGDNFAVYYSTYVKVDVAGTYEFQAGSKDGSVLYVDGVLVVDNNGLHGEAHVTGSYALSDDKWHKIEVAMFQGTGTSALFVQYKAPGKNWRFDLGGMTQVKRCYKSTSTSSSTSTSTSTSSSSTST